MSRPGTCFRAIFGAQVRNLLRDRRALVAAFVLPVLLYPLLFLGRKFIEDYSSGALESRTIRVALDVSRAPEDMRQRVRAAVEECEPIEVLEVDAAHVLEGFEWRFGPERNIASNARAAARLAEGQEALIAALPGERAPSWSLLTWFDGTNDLGIEAERRLRAALHDLEEAVADERRLALLGYDPARGLALSPIDVASAADASGSNLGRWLPLLAIFVLLGGASHAALTAFAGEREAGTLKTLLVHPVPAVVVVAAKFAAVLSVGVFTLMLNAGSVIGSLALGFGTLPGASEGAFALDATRVMLGALAFFPAAVLVCAVLCLVCGRARTFREGQNLLLPMMLVAIVPTIPALSSDVRLDAFLAAVPLTGPSLVLRDVLRGSASPALAVWMFAASTAWAALALIQLARTLDSERLVQHAPNEDEARDRRLASRGALRWALVVVFAVYMVGGWWQSLHAVWGLAATLWILLPLAAWASARSTARRSGESLASVLAWRAPRVAHVLAPILAAPAVAWAAKHVFAWQQGFLPLPREFESMALPLEIAGLGIVAQVLLLALSPAICEELFFRGAFLGGIRREMSTWKILVAQAFFFGAVHASLHRFLPTALLGALLAALTLRTRSLAPAIALHAAYNALLVFGERAPLLADPRLAWLALPAAALLVFQGPVAETGTAARHGCRRA